MNKTKNKIKAVFIGTPDFAVPSLKALVDDGQFDVIAVVTQPDKKVGRKQIITPPPVKVEAKNHGIPIFQPDKILNIKDEILDLKPDLIIVIAYAQIIPEDILNIPKYGVVNVHGSLLPKYRGASCIQAALLNGDKKTGVTIMKMDKGLDTGPILAQDEIVISEKDTFGSLYVKLSELGAKILTSSLIKYVVGEIKPVAQNNDKASYVGLLKKQDGEIDWKKDADEIERHVRAMFPWPGAFTFLGNKEQEIKNKKLSLKIKEVQHQSLNINEYKIGEIFLHNNELAVQCGKNSLIIKKLQLEGKKEVNADEFKLGYKKFIGFTLG